MSASGAARRPNGERVKTAFFFDPRAMLVTEIGGARPPNEIVLD